MNRGPVILQVEDDENDIFLLKHAFSKAGIKDPVHVVQDGQEAIEYLSGRGKYAERERFPLPSLILLDLKMPRKAGLDVIRWLRAESEATLTPVLVFSSSAQPGDIDRAYSAGANGFVVKPSGNGERIRFAQAIKEFWVDWNRPPSNFRRTPDLLIS